MTAEQSTRPPDPAAETLWYRFRRDVVQVVVREPALAPDASRLYASHAFARPAKPPGHRFQLGPVADDGTVSFYSAGAPAITGLDPIEGLEALEWALTEVLTAAYADHVHLHAGGAVVEGRAVLVLGPSGAGKSSLAFAFHWRGAPVLGDDVVLLNDRGHAVPFRRAFKLDYTRLRDAGIDPATTPGWYDGSPEAWFEPDGAGAWARPSPVGVIALSRVVPGTTVSVRERPRRAGLAALTGAVLSSGRAAAAAIDALVEATRPARFVELEFGDASAAVAALSELVIGPS